MSRIEVAAAVAGTCVVARVAVVRAAGGGTNPATRGTNPADSSLGIDWYSAARG
jgi:hypothetical protein